MNPVIHLSPKGLYEFGPFRMDSAKHLLQKNGKPIQLPPKAFEILILLVEKKGDLVAKGDLLHSVWPDTFVEENNLNQYVSMLRKVLGDGGNDQEYIQTVPKLGYRFVSSVREIRGHPSDSLKAGESEVVVTKRTRTHIVLREEEEELSDEPVLTTREISHQQLETVAGARWRQKTVFIAATLASLLLVLLSAVIYRSWTRGKSAVPSAGPRTLAVLPLRNLQPGAETDFLSVALTDAIISRLGYASEVSVEPLSSVIKYRNTDADPRQIARELNVQNVLAGSYIKDGDDLRITTEFISADKSSTPRRENVQLKYDKLFRVQDWVAASVIHSMGLELRPEEAERLKQGVPTNPEAYEYYLRGIDKGFKSDWESSAKLLEQSVALEPGNAMAWNALGGAYLAYGGIQGGDSGYIDKGWQAFHRAMALAPNNRFIVDVMAFQLLEHNRADQAIPILQESLRHNPADSFAHWYLSEAYRYGGALNQSVSEGELALKLNPNVAENLTFNTYLYLGQYRKFLESLPRDENNARAIFYRGLARYYLNDMRGAEEEFDRAFALNPALLHAQIGRALACGLRHQNEQGIELMGRIERAGNDDGEMIYKMAQAYAQLGDRQSSLRLLRRSMELNFYPYYYFAQDPLLDPVRVEPEYFAVIELARQRQEAFLKRLHQPS